MTVPGLVVCCKCGGSGQIVVVVSSGGENRGKLSGIIPASAETHQPASGPMKAKLHNHKGWSPMPNMVKTLSKGCQGLIGLF
jgi:hypothetical protein